MRFITGIAIKINRDRGDEIYISQLDIPDYTEQPSRLLLHTSLHKPHYPT